MSAPAGWYPDPSDASRQRWWDGARWTAHESVAAPAYAAATPTYGVPASVPQPYARVDADTNTVWIWVAIGVSALSLFSLFLFDVNGYVDAVVRSTQSSQGATDLIQWQLRSLAISAMGWIVAAAYIVSSWLDRRELLRRGIPGPFHWAWSFLGLLVYVIGRAVVLKRRTVRGGWAPMWVMIGLTAIGVIVAIVFTVTLTQTMVERMMDVYPGA